MIPTVILFPDLHLAVSDDPDLRPWDAQELLDTLDPLVQEFLAVDDNKAWLSAFGNDA